MKSTSAEATKLVGSFQNDGGGSAGHGVLGLSAEEADLLELLPLGGHEPWVVPLTVRLNAVADEMSDE